MNIEIFSTKLASQQHQHQAGNLQHEAGITTTSTRSWKSLARGWHQQHQHKAANIQHEVGIENISMKLEIFSTRLTSTT
jgi:hypothetical protein